MSIELLLRIATFILKQREASDLDNLLKLIESKSDLKELIFKNAHLFDASFLKKHNFLTFNNPKAQAEKIFCIALKCKREYLHVNRQKEIKQYKRFIKLVLKRANSYPLEYLSQEVEFYENIFFVNKNVLIPRVETEILVSKALELIRSKDIRFAAEVGSGSGALSLSIALHADIKILSCDISSKALKVAMKNAKALKERLLGEVSFKYSNLLESILPKDCNSLLISNPPYIADTYRLNKEVLYEPKLALFGGHKGDELLKELIKQASSKGFKYLACEIGYNQEESMRDFLESKGFSIIEFYKDYNNFTRGFIACKN